MLSQIHWNLVSVTIRPTEVSDRNSHIRPYLQKHSLGVTTSMQITLEAFDRWRDTVRRQCSCVDNTLEAVVKVDRRISWHYTTTILRLRIGARLTRYRNCKFHNGCRTISRHADGISRYSVPPSAGPLLPLRGGSHIPPEKAQIFRERRCVLLSHYFGHLSLLCVRGFDRSSSRWRSTCRIASCRATCDSASPTTTSTATTARCSTNKTFSTSSTNASRR